MEKKKIIQGYVILANYPESMKDKWVIDTAFIDGTMYEKRKGLIHAKKTALKKLEFNKKKLWHLKNWEIRRCKIVIGSKIKITEVKQEAMQSEARHSSQA
jgi:hypothetical protein